MAMKVFRDEPGSAAWHQRRQRSFNASDAPAMLGCSTNKTRTELLHEYHTTVAREFSDYVQERVINPGYRVEAVLRPIAAEIMDEDDLEVIGGALDVGLSRPIGASLDGRAFLGNPNWECKSLNDELRANLPHEGRDSAERNDGTKLHKMYRVQMEQQCMVTGATRCLFSAGKLDHNGEVIEERHCWYDSDPALQAEILAGWKQFDADLAVYVPEAPKVERVVAEPVEALPAVVTNVSGSIAVTDNFDEFEVKARHFFAHVLIRAPKTDQDFVNLAEQINKMKLAEEALDRAEAQMLAQVDAVYTRTQRKKMLLDLVRDNRLLSEKLLASEKERRRTEIVVNGADKLRAHVEALNKRLGGNYLSNAQADFAGAIKGKRSLDNMEDAVSTLLANTKIVLNEQADRVQANLAALRERQDVAFLFPDVLVLVHKAPDDLRATITARIAEHEAKEKARIEAERERIATEERAKAEAAARAEQEAERARIRAEEEAKARAEADRRQAEERAAAQAQAALAQAAAPAPVTAPAPAAAAPVATQATRPLFAVAASAPAAPKSDARITLGEINTRLQHWKTSAEGLAALGFVAERERGACLYFADDLDAILAAMVEHIETLREQLREPVRALA